MNEEILKIIKERGLLLEKEIFEMLEAFKDGNIASSFLINLEKYSGQKVITKSLLIKNLSFIKNIAGLVPGENKDSFERVCIKLGIHLEVSKEKQVQPINNLIKREDYKIFYADTKTYKKLEVSDFTNNFKSRFQQLQRILMQRSELNGLMSISKISSNRQTLCIIGMLKDKKVTKNKNIILHLEDLTGEIQCLVRSDKGDVFNKANELQLDDVVAIKASGNRDMLFINEIYFPDAFISEKKRFEEEANIAFLSDVHAGSDRHLGKSFLKFLDWINSEHEDAKKVKYIFFSGDNVDGVGIFPGQENVLSLKSMKEQYHLLASYLKQIPKNITIFMCPGQHDAVRVAEPQPLIDRRYAQELYEIENLVLVTNPTLVQLTEKHRDFKVLMYHGASIHNFINEIPELREIKAHKSPAKAVKHMLKRRHLAPTHSSVVYIPNEDKDPLVISEVPDILCTGEVHRLDIESYNGVLIITGSCWQSQTPFEEKVGNIPDPCKVPLFNLRTREIKILDFTEGENAIC